MPSDSKPHSGLTDETFHALVNAVTSRFQTIGDSRKVVDQEGLRREYERILGGLFEQLEAAHDALNRIYWNGVSGYVEEVIIGVLTPEQRAAWKASSPAKEPRL